MNALGLDSVKGPDATVAANIEQRELTVTAHKLSGYCWFRGIMRYASPASRLLMFQDAAARLEALSKPRNAENSRNNHSRR
jgi:hypothetical protein